MATNENNTIKALEADAELKQLMEDFYEAADRLIECNGKAILRMMTVTKADLNDHERNVRAALEYSKSFLTYYAPRFLEGTIQIVDPNVTTHVIPISAEELDKFDEFERRCQEDDVIPVPPGKSYIN